MRLDAATLHFTAPCLLIVPAGAVHGFEWDLASSGSVFTLASSYLADFVRRDPDLAFIFSRGEVIGSGDMRATGPRMAKLAQELGWAAPGHRAAVDAGCLELLVSVLRMMEPRPSTTSPPRPQALVVARLRERIEERFRLRETVEDYAGALEISPRRLRAACAAAARQSPGDVLDQRAMLEARRSLIYGTLSVAEVGYSLGFEDPAYFSRFFSRHAGVSPATYRKGERERFADS